jgi:hypothetical protein
MNQRWSVLPLLALAACGSTEDLVDGGDATAATDVGLVDVQHDTSVDVVDASDGGVEAGSDAPPPFSIPLKCADETQCDAGGVCCATLTFKPGCVIQEIASACKPPSSCPTALQPFCKGTETVRMCVSNAACTEPGADHCCTFDINGAYSLVMCASLSSAASAGATCQ